MEKKIKIDLKEIQEEVLERSDRAIGYGLIALFANSFTAIMVMFAIRNNKLIADYLINIMIGIIILVFGASCLLMIKYSRKAQILKEIMGDDTDGNTNEEKE